MSRLVIGPFNRVEGDLEVRLDVGDGTVRKAEVTSPLYRGFEHILRGRVPEDALVYAPRICGICSVSQSVAAARSLGDILGAVPTDNGRLVTNLVHAAENVADHLTHFYLFFMPDFARTPYAGESWYGDAAARFQAIKGTASADMLPARAQWMHIMGILTGHWPHTLGIRPGGSTRSVTAAERARLSGILSGFRRFLERHLFADRLEVVAALSSADDLAAWADARLPSSGDFPRFLALSQALGLNRLGRAGTLFMSYGAYEGAGSGDGSHLFGSGLAQAGAVQPLDISGVTEDTSNSWYLPGEPLPPAQGETIPGDGISGGYSWCKAPRLQGQPVEVGAVARQLIAGHPLIRDLVGKGPANVHVRIVARMLEIARVVMAMEGWVAALRPTDPFQIDVAMPVDGDGIGLTEAARGSLGHWLSVRDGRISNYQIIAPTTWNFSPRDANGVPGPLELALEGTPVRPGEGEPVAVQHIVRSFDPCMVCTVH